MASSLNLKTYFGDDLHDYPESPEDLKTFVEMDSQEIEGLAGDEKFKRLSRLAVHYRQLRSYSKAHELFTQASNYFEENNLQMAMVNFLRWGDVFRFEKRFSEARVCLESAEKILSVNSFTEYQDFYFQHLGKLYFDEENFKEAISCFEKALELRIQKKNPELISSSEFALSITRKKIIV